MIELAVASLVLMVALALAADLLQESLHIFSGSVRELGRASEETARLRLSGDLRALEPPSEVSSSCSPLPLELTDAGRRVTWSLEAGRLVRTTRASGVEVSTPLLPDLIGFCWRQAEPGWIEVVLVRRTPERTLAWRLASAQWRQRDERTEVAALGIAPRRGWR